MTDNFFVNVQNSLSQATISILTSIVSYIPTLLAALIVFVIGLVLANWLKLLVIKLTNLLRLSDLLGKGGAKQFLANRPLCPPGGYQPVGNCQKLYRYPFRRLRRHARPRPRP